MENTTTIKEQWAAFKAQNPKVRIRDAAKQLGLSEAELVNADDNNLLLEGDLKEVLKETSTLGYVMALTRNDYCVHERKGIYKKVGFNGNIGLVVTPDIDLRIFMTHWHFGFAVNENDRLSLQFFDADGSAVHKIYLTEQSDAAAYQALVDKYKAENQAQQLTITAAQPAPAEKPDSDVDVKAFGDAWLALQDTHDFHGLLRQHGLSRTQALRLAPEGHALPISVERLKAILTKASETDVPVMVFTGSTGVIQIHTGEIKKIVQTGPWFNILDPEFNMHLREDGIATAWLVKKPTADGPVHSLEVFDADGNTIVQFFGKRKPGIPESQDWQGLLNSIQ